MRVIMKKIYLSLILVLSGCATIISGTTTSINLIPSNASDYEDTIKVQVSNKNTLQTIQLPGSVLVKTGGSPLLVAVKDKCFRETTTTIEPKVNYVFLGNIITGGLTGTTTDALSGALWTYDDSFVVNVVENGTCKASK